MDRDGQLNKHELQHMIDILLFVAKENKVHFEAQKASTFERQNTLRQSRESLNKREAVTFKTMGEEANKTDNFDRKLSSDSSSSNPPRLTLDEIYAKLLLDLKQRLTVEEHLTQEEFLMWSVNNNVLIAPLLELLFQVCHVSLGLKPHCRHHEHEIVMGWLDREERRNISVGQFWYLISSDWWQSWINYTTGKKIFYNVAMGFLHSIDANLDIIISVKFDFFLYFSVILFLKINQLNFVILFGY